MKHTYSRIDGKIYSAKCEINVAEHCNLSCRGCSHLSPVVPKSFVDPAEVLADLTNFASPLPKFTIRTTSRSRACIPRVRWSTNSRVTPWPTASSTVAPVVLTLSRECGTSF